MTPGTWIKKLRMKKELKQAVIAKRLGITQQAYSKIENSIWIRKGRLPELLEALDSNLEELKRIGAIFKIAEMAEMQFNEPEESMRA
jgi:transcriptional regulator with XRE-family HTH domain